MLYNFEERRGNLSDNKCSLDVIIGSETQNYDRQTDQPTDRPTDRLIGGVKGKFHFQQDQNKSRAPTLKAQIKLLYSMRRREERE